MASSIDSAKRWRARAEEARAIADQLTDTQAKRLLWGIALAYQQLAQHAEARRGAKISK